MLTPVYLYRISDDPARALGKNTGITEIKHMVMYMLQYTCSTSQ